MRSSLFWTNGAIHPLLQFRLHHLHDLVQVAIMRTGTVRDLDATVFGVVPGAIMLELAMLAVQFQKIVSSSRR